MLDPLVPRGAATGAPGVSHDAEPSEPALHFLAPLGLHGLESLELPLSIHTITGTPLYLVGDRGCAKSRVLVSFYRSLKLKAGVYNLAMSTQIEDLAGWPDAKALSEGTWAWQEAPHVVWGKQALVFDELPRVVPALQGKLFDLLRDRSVMGTPIEGLQLCSATGNPPGPGSHPLDEALVGRFGLLVRMPTIQEMSPQDREGIIQSVGESDAPLADAFHCSPPDYDTAGTIARAIIEAGRAELPATIRDFGPAATRYVLEISDTIDQVSPSGYLDGRRLGMLFRNLLTALALARRGYRWFEDDYQLVFRTLCLSLPWVASEPEVDFTRLAGTHAAAWRVAFAGAESRDLGLRVPRAGEEDLGALIDHYAERAAEMSEDEHGYLLGQVFGRAGDDNAERRVAAMAEGLRVVRSLLGRTDVPAAVVARALSWADRVAGIGSRSEATAVEDLLYTVNVYHHVVGPRDALALRLAMEASRRGHPGSDAPFEANKAQAAFTRAAKEAYRLLETEQQHPSDEEE